MAPPLVRHLEEGIMGGVCVTIMEVRYDNMEGGLVIGWFAPKKLKRGVRSRHLTSLSNLPR
jgi:hypothetical protein